ncbi:hypothetical protein [Paraliomyxa miuraensis]|uniref:hypothetical protein n=1 Tax=Paraliomyxa miuraensis TaxID=376150 RepID=UPI00224D5C95|nr:hypothetical protein [Paraliomyxa miuraensis]MCX4245737.1 hypothetical protein [Paraliomyxa miuraensis]
MAEPRSSDGRAVANDGAMTAPRRWPSSPGPLLAGLGLVALALAWWCQRPDEPSPVDEPPATTPVAAALPGSDPDPRLPVAADPILPTDCDALAALAREGGPDAVLLAWLCPSRPLDPVVARAALLAVRSPDEAAALAPALAAHPALQGLARLVAQDAAAVPPASSLEDPGRAVVSPIDDHVLAQVRRAHAVVTTRGLSHADRTRAQALLAKVYLQATQQLGVSMDRPPEPFARLLAGRALHHGRLFCHGYWQGRVAGLARLFRELEPSLASLVTALEGSPHHADAARLSVELEDARRYVQRDGPRGRIERYYGEHSGPAWTIDRLRPFPAVLDRLLDLGFVDLAIAQAIEEAVRPEGPGLRPMEQLLRDAMARAERSEYLALLDARLARARSRSPPPPEFGTSPLRTVPMPWDRPEAIASEAAAWIERAPREADLARSYALGRALLLVRARPDALVVLLDQATAEDASPALTEAAAWLERELWARDDGRLPWLARRIAVHPRSHPTPSDASDPSDASEAERRRHYALRMRELDRQPRGPGLWRREG